MLVWCISMCCNIELDSYGESFGNYLVGCVVLFKVKCKMLCIKVNGYLYKNNLSNGINIVKYVLRFLLSISLRFCII